MSLFSLFSSNKNSYTIFCSRCGNEYSSESRYCMKCGNLNPDHPKNKKMVPYISNHKEEYSVGKGQDNVKVNQNEVSGKGASISLGSNTGNYNLCFTINLLVYLFLIIISGLAFSVTCNFDWREIISSSLGIVWIGISIFYILFYSIQLVYMKMNSPWWCSFIPFVNNIVLSKCLYGSPLIGILTFIPGIGILFNLILFYKLGSKFKRSGLLTALFPIIMYPVIGYGSSSFDGSYYVSGRNSLEKEFRKKNGFLTMCVLFLFLGGAMFVYNNFNNIKETSKSVSKIYLVSTAKLIEKQMDEKINNDRIYCSSGTNDDVLYFYFGCVDDYFSIPYGVMFDTMSATVKVDRSDGKTKYYIAITDGKYGFDETLSSDINSNSVTEFNALNESYRNKCKVRR